MSGMKHEPNGGEKGNSEKTQKKQANKPKPKQPKPKSRKEHNASPDMTQPDVSAKCMADHALTTVEELFVDKSLFTRWYLLNRPKDTRSESCTKSRWVLF